MKKPAVGAAGLGSDFDESILDPIAGEQASPQSQPVLDLDQQVALNKLDAAPESNSRPSQKTRPHPSGFGQMREENSRVPAPAAVTQVLLSRLKPISKTDRLLPVGGGSELKAPVITDWPNHPGVSIPDILRFKRLRSIGIAMDHLVCIDVDGITAIERLLVLGLLDPELISTWRIDRDNDPNRFKLIWRPTPEQLPLLPKRISGKDSTKPPVKEGRTVLQKGEAVERFALHTGRQVVVIGNHYSGGNYCWPQEQGPEALAPLPSQWFDYIVEQERDYPKPAAGAHRTVSTGRGDWKRLAQCPICGRNENTVCQVHTDGETIRCFKGSTFCPPVLLPGERTGEWRYKRDQHVGWGTFAIFHRDNLGSPLQRLRRQHRD